MLKGARSRSAVFTIDLRATAAGDPNVPVVNRDPETFFRATYLTADLQQLLEKVLASFAGKSGYNRVLMLRTPFLLQRHTPAPDLSRALELLQHGGRITTKKGDPASGRGRKPEMICLCEESEVCEEISLDAQQT